MIPTRRIRVPIIRGSRMGIESHLRCTPWVVRSHQRTRRQNITFGLRPDTLQQIKEGKSRRRLLWCQTNRVTSTPHCMDAVYRNTFL